MKLMPIGGKSTNNTAIPVSVDNNGNINIKRIWQNKKITLMNAESIRDTSAYTTISTVCDCKQSAMVSLRFYNTLGVPVTINIYNDNSAAGSDYMKDFYGSVLSFTVPGGYTIVTPDDLPCLKYIEYLKLRIQATQAPTSGAFTALAYLKG